MVLKSIISSLLILGLSTSWHSENQVHEKRIGKVLNSIWPDQEVKTNAIDSVELKDDESAASINIDGLHVGYYIYDSAPSRYDVFDFVLVFDTAGRILLPKILVYREDHGGEIASRRWLKQFIGMGADDELELQKDIRNIAGATISCSSACRGFKDATSKINSIINGKH